MHPPDADEPTRGRILLADDEAAPRRALGRLLRVMGFDVVAVDSGAAALANLVEQRAGAAGLFDALITDLTMPGMSGLELLQAVRTLDADLPVILITGAPAAAAAEKALDQGAYKYLLKPVTGDCLEESVTRAVQLRQLAQLRRQAMEVMREQAADDELGRAFTHATAGLWMAFQPIVDRRGALVGHEALLRTKSDVLRRPPQLLDAAERLGRVQTLGRQLRAAAAEPLRDRGAAGCLFVNLHPLELVDDELVAVDSPLATLAERVVVELTERARVDSLHDLRERIAGLRERGFRIAVDDVGAGYGGLTSFALLEPDLVKLDTSLVREVHARPAKRQVIAAVTEICRDLGIQVVGEGVETAVERDVLLELGCDLFQGNFIAAPAAAFPTPHW